MTIPIIYGLIVLNSFIYFVVESKLEGTEYAVFPSEIKEIYPNLNVIGVACTVLFFVIINPLGYIFKLLHWIVHHRRYDDENESGM